MTIPHLFSILSSKEDLGNCILEDWNKVVDTIYPPLSDQVDTNGKTERRTDRQAGRQTDTQTDRQADRQTDRETDRHTDR